MTSYAGAIMTSYPGMYDLVWDAIMTSYPGAPL